MKPGKIVYQGVTKTNQPFLIRYLDVGDTQILLDYINTLSKEQTFIRFQGEQLSIEEEQQFVDKNISGIQKGRAVQLLAFSDSKLIGVSGVNMMEKVEKHNGLFGISLAKEFRSEGIGTILMEKVLEESENNLEGLKIIILTMFGTNDVAKKLYEKMGFIEYGRLPEGIIFKDQFVDYVYMYKDLSR